MSRRSAAALALFALVAAFAPPVRAEESVPAYLVPPALAAEKLAGPLDAAARAAVASIRDPASSDEAEDAVRVLAGLGRGAVPHLVRALGGADWYARAALVAAVAEMDAPDVTPLLAQACGDPAFAVRQAAVTGLGKIGDARGAEALAARAAAATEPAWRVRVTSATAVRRAVLRGTIARAAGEAALVGLLDDPDEEVRRAALVELAPLAADSALPALLAIFVDPATPSSDRSAALNALRSYRSPSPELLSALRRGFLAGEDPSASVEAGRALLAMQGAPALADSEVSDALVHGLHEPEHDALRDGLARLGRPAAPWLRTQVLTLAQRIALGQAVHGNTSFETLLDTLVQVDETAGLALVKELLTSPESPTYERETRLAVLTRVEHVFAPRLAAELRALCDGRAGDDLRPELLRAIVASEGEDLAARLDAAIGDAKKVRAAALELLDRRPDLEAGPRLLALAREAADPSERRAAIETLSRRDPAEAARIASKLLDDPRADMRSKAITVLSASRDPADFDRLVARLAREDGADERPAKPAPADSAGTTPSEHPPGLASSRRRMLNALIPAVRLTGGARARPVLLAITESESDAVVREAAARSLRGIVQPEDATRIAAVETAETDLNTRREMLRTLATLGGAPEATARFEKLVADARTRTNALDLLAEDASNVVPAGLEAGMRAPEWTDAERVHALVALDRAGRAPAVASLAALVAGSRTIELSITAAKVLAASPRPEATKELTSLLSSVTDAERLAIVVGALGSRGASEAEGPLLDLFAATRDRALACRFVSDPPVELLRCCAEALAEFGSERTGEALVGQLFDPRLAHAVARARYADGSFPQPSQSAPITIACSLVAALAHRDEESCRRLVAARFGALAADGRDVALPEEFLAGVARYLREPLAFKLPARPRPAAAAVLWRVVDRTAPRMSNLDRAALQAADDEFAEAGRYADAAAALRSLAALSDVEDAARSHEERLVLACRIAARDAQALAAAGRMEDALAIVRKLREPDPTNGELAYRQGWCLARIGRPDAEARDALLFAAAQDDKDARIHFQLGWVTERLESPVRALDSYDQAVVLDRKRVEERSGEEIGGGYGVPYETGAYLYWYARALRAAGETDGARTCLAGSVELDDRFAVQARSDPAFTGWDALEPTLAAGLAKTRAGALR